MLFAAIELAEFVLVVEHLCKADELLTVSTLHLGHP